MTNETKLSDLKAKDLKVIATNKGLTFDKMDSAETMLKILADAGITEIPSEKNDGDGSDEGEGSGDGDGNGSDSGEESDEKEVPQKASKLKKGRLDFVVVTPIRRSGVDYKPGTKIHFDEFTPEVEELFASNVIR